MTISSALREMLDALANAGIAGVETLTAEQARTQAETMSRARAIGDFPEVAGSDDIVIPAQWGELAARVYRPRSVARMLLVYFHGGGWVLGSLDHSDVATRIMCERLGAVIVSVDYRLAPEHPFPAALEDALTALDWVRAHRDELAPGLPIVIGGDSAGANLATAAALVSKEAGTGFIDAQFLLYPVTDRTLSHPSYVENASGYILTAAAMAWFWEQYLPEESRDDPRASPFAAADLTGMPPTVIVTAQYDPLRDEGIAYGRRLADAGVQVTALHFDDLVHGFISMATALPEAGRALDQACAAVVDLVDDAR